MHWYAVYTGPRAERRACASISALGVTTYLPVWDRVVTHARRRKVVATPLLSRYLFAQFSVQDDWGRILHADGVEDILSNAGSPVAIPEAQMERIMDWKDHPEIIAAAKAGDVMRIIGGPLQGHNVVLTYVWPERHKAKGDVVLFRRATATEFDLEQLESV